MMFLKNFGRVTLFLNLFPYLHNEELTYFED